MPVLFPADAVGELVDCPHCGQSTKLYAGVASASASGVKPLRIALPAPLPVVVSSASGGLPSQAATSPVNSSLHPCPDCGQQISKRASACPHCGCPIAAGMAHAVAPMTTAASATRSAGIREEKTNSATGTLLSLVGVCGVIFFGFVFLASLQSLGKIQRTENHSDELLGSSALVAVFMALLWIVSALVFRAGRRMMRKFVCAACGNRVDGRNVKLCPSCRVTLT